MIECDMTYDLLPNVDTKAYLEWAKKTIGTMAKQPGMVEFRANRNILGNPQIRTVSVWRSLDDWAKFNQNVWQPLQAELRGHATNIDIRIWGPSPILAEPLRPAK
jgi:heme-degrading monooxygenase HmoA